MIGDITDFSKLRIIGKWIHYKIRQQDGSWQLMTANNIYENRIFVSWLQIHDGA